MKRSTSEAFEKYSVMKKQSSATNDESEPDNRTVAEHEIECNHSIVERRENILEQSFLKIVDHEDFEK